MKIRKLFLLFMLSLLVFAPADIHANSLTAEERESLLEKYEMIKDRLEYLRWYVQKFDLKEELKAESYLVVDLEKDRELLERNTSYPYAFASITKLMSAVIAVEKLDLDKEIVLSGSMLGHNRISPALTLGTSVRAEDLMKASLIQSTNDASEALTHFLEEGEFVKLMNEKAENIGMKNTVFYDSHGLAGSKASQYEHPNEGTAKDIAKLLNYIDKNHPKILKITRNKDFQLPGDCPEHNWVCTFLNRNVFHDIENFVGGKTGYLGSISKQAFAGIFEAKEKPFLVVFLYSSDRKEDTKRVYKWLEKKPSSKSSQEIIETEIN